VALRRLTNLLLGADAELKTTTSFFIGVVPYSTTGIGHNCDPGDQLIQIDLGDGHQFHRDGNLVSLQYLLVKGCIFVAPTWEVPAFRNLPVAVTVCLWLDKRTKGAQADSSVVFGNYLGTAIGNTCIQRALFQRERFEVFRQEVFYFPQLVVMNDVNVPSYSDCLHTFEWFVPLDGLQVRYSGGGPSVTDVVDNSFHISAYSTVPPYHIITNPINGPVLEYSVSARYFSGPI